MRGDLYSSLNLCERTKIEASRGKISALTGGGGGCLMEHDVWVAACSADIETGQLLIIKHCQCPSAFCNYKCDNIGLLPNSFVSFPLFIINP